MNNFISPETRLLRLRHEHRDDHARRDALACDVVAEEIGEVVALLERLAGAAHLIPDQSLAAMAVRCSSAAIGELAPLADFTRKHGAGEWYS